MEAELDAVNSSLFRTSFQGPNYPQTLNVTGRCGSVHNPPNARFEYDRNNSSANKSDCLNWNPDQLGQLSQNDQLQKLGPVQVESVSDWKRFLQIAEQQRYEKNDQAKRLTDHQAALTNIQLQMGQLDLNSLWYEDEIEDLKWQLSLLEKSL